MSARLAQMCESWKAVRDVGVGGFEAGGGAGSVLVGMARINSNSTPKVRCWGGEVGACRAEKILVGGMGDGDEVAGWDWGGRTAVLEVRVGVVGGVSRVVGLV